MYLAYIHNITSPTLYLNEEKGSDPGDGMKMDK